MTSMGTIQTTRALRTTGLLGLLMVMVLAGCQTPQRRDRGTAEERALLERGEQYTQQGLLDSAMAAFDMVLETNPRAVDAHVGVGDIYEIRGDYAAAAEKYKTAKQLAPGTFKPTYKLGLMYHLLNKVREAVTEYLAALTIQPDSFEANLNLATAYLQLGQAELGLPYAEKAVKLKGDSQAAHVNLGSIYASMGQYDLAIDEYRGAAELGDLQPPILLNMVESLLKTGKYQRAMNVLEQLEATPTDVIYERMGYALFKLGEYEKSLGKYRLALRINPDDTASLNGLGVDLMTLYLKGRRENIALRDEAIDAWQKSVKADSSQQRIVDLIARYRKL